MHKLFLRLGALLCYQPQGEPGVFLCISNTLHQIWVYYFFDKMTLLTHVQFVFSCHHCCFFQSCCLAGDAYPYIWIFVFLSFVCALVSIEFCLFDFRQFSNLSRSLWILILSAKALVIIPILMSFTVPSLVLLKSLIFNRITTSRVPDRQCLICCLLEYRLHVFLGP